MMGVETGRIVLHISLETLLALLYTYFSLALEEILTAGSKKQASQLVQQEGEQEEQRENVDQQGRVVHDVSL
jgi:hypothetical protein